MNAQVIDNACILQVVLENREREKANSFQKVDTIVGLRLSKDNYRDKTKTDLLHLIHIEKTPRRSSDYWNKIAN